ncbi:MAG TPA: RyR domain-containing protein [Kineosporiaceae bacterium]
MAVNQSSEALRRPLGALRVAFPVVAAVSLVLGYVGFGQYLSAARSSFGDAPIDLVYYDLQLFVLGADPLQNGGSVPVLLQIARLTAPAVTLYALIEAARMLYSVEVSRWRARSATGHAIVCGDTRFADALTRTLRAEGTQVVEIRGQADDFVTAGEPLRIVGDARDPDVLRAAGIDQAAAVYACADGSAVNAAIALAARTVRARRSSPITVHSHIADPDLCATFQAAFLGQPARDDVRVDFFNINQIAARRLFDDDPVLAVESRPPSLMVSGPSGFGAAAVVAAARSWRVIRPNSAALPVSVTGPGAGSVVDELSLRYPFLTQACRFSTDERELLALLAAGEIHRPPDRLLVCHRDEEHALKTAMAAERSWRGRVRSIVVRLDSLWPYLRQPAGSTGPRPSHPDRAGVPAGEGAALLDAGTGVLRPFGVVAAACDLALIREDLIERLAHIIHERYRLGRRQRGEWVPGDPSLRPWHELTPRLRRANRAQAEDIGRKLADVHCTISPRFGPGGDVVLSEDDLDHLARSEHDRWLAEHRNAGWQFAPERCEKAKLHPGLRPWAQLPTPFRNRCHDAVRELSDILADAGFRIVRG